MNEPPTWLVRAVQLHQDIEDADEDLSIISSDISGSSGPGYYLGKGLVRLGRPFWRAMAQAVVARRFEYYHNLSVLRERLPGTLAKDSGLGLEFSLSIYRTVLDHYRFVFTLTVFQLLASTNHISEAHMVKQW